MLILLPGEVHSDMPEKPAENSDIIHFETHIVINRPGVAGAVLQSPPSLIHSLINQLRTLFLQTLITSLRPNPES